MKKLSHLILLVLGISLSFSSTVNAGNWSNKRHNDNEKHQSKNNNHQDWKKQKRKGKSCNGGGHKPPQPSCGCDGKVNYLKLRYDGLYDSTVVINQQKGEEVFSESLTIGEEFELFGVDKKGTLSPTITINRDGSEIDVHTSCSEPIGHGTLIVDPIAEQATGEEYAFVVIEGSSRNIDTLCEQGEIPPAPEPPTEFLPPIVEAGPDITIIDGSPVELPNIDELFGEAGNTGAFERVAELVQVDGAIVSYDWTREELFYSDTLRAEALESELLIANFTTHVCALADVSGDVCSIERYTITVIDENGLSDSDSFSVTTIRDSGNED